MKKLILISGAMIFLATSVIFAQGMKGGMMDGKQKDSMMADKMMSGGMMGKGMMGGMEKGAGKSTDSVTPEVDHASHH